MKDEIKILVYMFEHGGITVNEAKEHVHTTECRKCISNLRAKGIRVLDEWIPVTRADGVKTKIKRYFLPHEVMEQYRKDGVQDV